MTILWEFEEKHSLEEPVVFKPPTKLSSLRSASRMDRVTRCGVEGTCPERVFCIFNQLYSSPRQNRHPERSASRICRVTRRLWRGVEGPRRRFIYPLRL